MMKTQLLNDDILDVFNLKNQYKIFNLNMMSFLDQANIEFMKEIQQITLKKDEEIGGILGHNNLDYYDAGWVRWAGENALITRNMPYPHREDIETGLLKDILRSWNMDIFNPQFGMMTGASVLAINPIGHHHQDREGLAKDYQDLLDGKKIGSICITEPGRGSDAVNMEVQAERVSDGFVINGIKSYNTNSPKADITVVYAVTNPKDPRNTMIQGVSHKDWDRGFKAERIGIGSVNKVHIGKTIFEDAHIPMEYITGTEGEGYKILFEGLVPERIGIAASNVGQCWGAFTLAMLYTNVRKQFGVEILKHQAIGMSVMAKYYGRLMQATMALLKLAETYDARKDKLPDDPMKNPYVGVASQMKETTAQLVHELTYECMHAMGGTGVTDQTKMPLYQGISEIAEVVGGTRNVQYLIGSRAIRNIFGML
ncbi:MAG: acyl-CoA dehydrogenase family protein [Candidatus Kariarchaeaceae archaeon]|jgi:alkylation response protein AidB-like acyl-CoA dehydrogenase